MSSGRKVNDPSGNWMGPTGDPTQDRRFNESRFSSIYQSLFVSFKLHPDLSLWTSLTTIRFSLAWITVSSSASYSYFYIHNPKFHQKSVSYVYLRFQRLSVGLSVVLLCKSQTLNELTITSGNLQNCIKSMSIRFSLTCDICVHCQSPIFLHKCFLSCAGIVLLCSVRRAADGMGKGNKGLSYYVACPTHPA